MTTVNEMQGVKIEHFPKTDTRCLHLLCKVAIVNLHVEPL